MDYPLESIFGAIIFTGLVVAMIKILLLHNEIIKILKGDDEDGHA